MAGKAECTNCPFVFYDNDEFLGIFEVITHFNSIAVKLRKKGIEPIILVDKKYKKQLIKPFTKLFIGDYYVANLNANRKYMNFIEQSTIEYFLTYKKDYHEHNITSNLITIYSLPDINSNPMGYFILFKPFGHLLRIGSNIKYLINNYS